MNKKLLTSVNYWYEKTLFCNPKDLAVMIANTIKDMNKTTERQKAKEYTIKWLGLKKEVNEEDQLISLNLVIDMMKDFENNKNKFN